MASGMPGGILILGTITARKRKDGTTGYKVQIILKSGGAIAHREARTFDRRQAANAWMVRRERELAEPGALERIKDASADPTLGRIIERYVAEHAKAMGSTKAGVLNSIKASNLAEMRCSAIGSADVIDYLRALDASPATRQT